MTKSIVLRLIIGAFLFGLGVYICFTTMPWLADQYVLDIWVAVYRVLWIFIGWGLVFFGAKALYFTFKDMEKQSD
jgi:hypothetical protein